MKERIRTGTKADRWGYVFVAPFLIAVAIFTLYPIINMVIMSFTNATNRDFTQSLRFLGFSNYTTVFDNDRFMSSIGNTWKLWIMNFIPQLGIALLLSVWFTSLRLRLKFIGIFRTIFYLPNLLMPATVAALYNMLIGNSGPLNRMLYSLGISQWLVKMNLVPENYLLITPGMDGAPDGIAVILTDIPSFMTGMVAYMQWWLWFGTTIIIVMAGMTSISVSLYESAYVDGASGGTIFFKITLPLLRPVMLYILVTSLVGGMQIMDIPYMFNVNGRPGGRLGEFDTMNVVMVHQYFHGTRNPYGETRNLGLAAAAGMMIFGVILIATIVLLLLMRIGKDKEPKKEKTRKGGVRA
ncbi:MAG: sugar ABC transporter permease [Oscillospiraceae bacterium]|nr:sugar ABC transporter permease [Oscillospiraceae bacterium]